MPTIYECRIGDTIYTVTQEGFTDDAEPLICGYLVQTVFAPVVSRFEVELWREVCRIGLCWDEQRTLIFASGTCHLDDNCRNVLTEAGFTIP